MLMWKIVGASKASVLYIYIYIDILITLKENTILLRLLLVKFKFCFRNGRIYTRKVWK